jgi:hypothetical protein
MNDNPETTSPKRNIWVRGLFMLLMAVAFHLCEIILGVVTVIQFLITLLNDIPNARLASFGRNLGIYLRQITNFLTFAAEEIPFPFNEWPAGE